MATFTNSQSDVSSSDIQEISRTEDGAVGLQTSHHSCQQTASASDLSGFPIDSTNSEFDRFYTFASVLQIQLDRLKKEVFVSDWPRVFSSIHSLPDTMSSYQDIGLDSQQSHIGRRVSDRYYSGRDSLRHSVDLGSRATVENAQDKYSKGSSRLALLPVPSETTRIRRYSDGSGYSTTRQDQTPASERRESSSTFSGPSGSSYHHDRLRDSQRSRTFRQSSDQAIQSSGLRQMDTENRERLQKPPAKKQSLSRKESIIKGYSPMETINSASDQHTTPSTTSRLQTNVGNEISRSQVTSRPSRTSDTASGYVSDSMVKLYGRDRTMSLTRGEMNPRERYRSSDMKLQTYDQANNRSTLQRRTDLEEQNQMQTNRAQAHQPVVSRRESAQDYNPTTRLTTRSSQINNQSNLEQRPALDYQTSRAQMQSRPSREPDTASGYVSDTLRNSYNSGVAKMSSSRIVDASPRYERNVDLSSRTRDQISKTLQPKTDMARPNQIPQDREQSRHQSVSRGESMGQNKNIRETISNHPSQRRTSSYTIQHNNDVADRVRMRSSSTRESATNGYVSEATTPSTRPNVDIPRRETYRSTDERRNTSDQGSTVQSSPRRESTFAEYSNNRHITQQNTPLQSKRVTDESAMPYTKYKSDLTAQQNATVGNRDPIATSYDRTVRSNQMNQRTGDVSQYRNNNPTTDTRTGYSLNGTQRSKRYDSRPIENDELTFPNSNGAPRQRMTPESIVTRQNNPAIRITPVEESAFSKDHTLRPKRMSKHDVQENARGLELLSSIMASMDTNPSPKKYLAEVQTYMDDKDEDAERKFEKRKEQLSSGLDYMHSYIDGFIDKLMNDGVLNRNDFNTFRATIKGMISELANLAQKVGIAKINCRLSREMAEVSYRLSNIEQQKSKEKKLEKFICDICQKETAELPSKGRQRTGRMAETPKKENQDLDEQEVGANVDPANVTEVDSTMRSHLNKFISDYVQKFEATQDLNMPLDNALNSELEKFVVDYIQMKRSTSNGGFALKSDTSSIGFLILGNDDKASTAQSDGGSNYTNVIRKYYNRTMSNVSSFGTSACNGLVLGVNVMRRSADKALLVVIVALSLVFMFLILSLLLETSIPSVDGVVNTVSGYFNSTSKWEIPAMACSKNQGFKYSNYKNMFLEDVAKVLHLVLEGDIEIKHTGMPPF